MGVQISIWVSGDVTILDLWGRATIGADSELLSSHVRELVANGVRKLLLNLADLTQLDSSGISTIVGSYVSLTSTYRGPATKSSSCADSRIFRRSGGNKTGTVKSRVPKSRGVALHQCFEDTSGQPRQRIVSEQP